MTQQNLQNQQNPTPQQPAQQPQPMPQQPQQSQQPQPPQPNPQPMPQQAPQSQPQPQPLISFGTTAPEKPNAWDSIIAQQQEQINALMAQNQALTGQITQMVQGGAQFTQAPQQPQQAQQVQPQQVQQPQQYQTVTEFPPVYDGVSPLQTFNPPALSDNQDYSLEGLASEIGKKEK